MQFTYRFSSPLPPSEVAAHIAQSINPSLKKRVNDAFHKRLFYDRLDYYYGVVENGHFSLENRGTKIIAHINGTISLEGSGSVIDVQLNIKGSWVSSSIFGLIIIVVISFLPPTEYPSLTSLLFKAAVLMAVCSPILGIYQIRQSRLFLTTFFNKVTCTK